MNLRHSSIKMIALLVTSVLVSSLVSAAQQAKPKTKRRAKPSPVMQPIQDDPSLPRVLLLGDSISIGYTLAVRDLLTGKANVHRAPANCGPTTRGLEQIDAWLGEKPWDVIHFNWGLHDLKYMGPSGENLADPTASDSRQQVPPDQYEANLRKLVGRLSKTEATLIWCSTTPVPEGAGGRVVGDAVKYNEIAARVMGEYGVATNDLYSVAKPRLKAIQRPANVHFTPEGSKVLAAAVAKAITQALQRNE
jgi:acyl-CoA thioesterase-1